MWSNRLLRVRDEAGGAVVRLLRRGLLRWMLEEGALEGQAAVSPILGRGRRGNHRSPNIYYRWRTSEFFPDYLNLVSLCNFLYYNWNISNNYSHFINIELNLLFNGGSYWTTIQRTLSNDWKLSKTRLPWPLLRPQQRTGRTVGSYNIHRIHIVLL